MNKFKVEDWIVYVKTEDQTAYRIIEINENIKIRSNAINVLICLS